MKIRVSDLYLFDEIDLGFLLNGETLNEWEIASDNSLYENLLIEHFVEIMNK